MASWRRCSTLSRAACWREAARQAAACDSPHRHGAVVDGEAQIDWLCARAEACTGALAACAAWLPEVMHFQELVAHKLLPRLSAVAAAALSLTTPGFAKTGCAYS